MNKSELELVVSKYFYKDTEVLILNNKKPSVKIATEINNMLQNMVQFEEPDILSVYGNKIIGIEHFEFDSYKNTNKKGSNYRVENNRIKNNFDNYVDKELVERKTLTLTDSIKSTSSLKDYYDNFTKQFVKHYKNVDKYIKNIKSQTNMDNKEIEIWFFIEDVTPLGNYFLSSDKKIFLLNPFYNKKIVELIENSSKLSGIILGLYAMKEHRVQIAYNDRKNIKRFKENKIVVNDNNYLSFHPQTTGFATLISK